MCPLQRFGFRLLAAAAAAAVAAGAQDGACWPAAPGEARDHDPGGEWLNVGAARPLDHRPLLMRDGRVYGDVTFGTPLFLHIPKTGGSTLYKCAARSKALQHCNASHRECGSSRNLCGPIHTPLRASYPNMAAVAAVANATCTDVGTPRGGCDAPTTTF